LRASDPDHRLLCTEARGGVITTTAHHRLLDDDFDEIAARDVVAGDKLATCTEIPWLQNWTAIAPELAELLGLLAADGYVHELGAKIQFTNNDATLRTRVAELWNRCFLGSSVEQTLSSGFDPTRPVQHLRLNGPGAGLGQWLREQLYTRRGHKQVPPLVLNAGPDQHDAFIKGYYAGDGLKKGKGASVKTNSPVLALGLVWLYALNGQQSSVYVEHRAGKTYYQLNLASPVRVGAKGQHLRRDPAEVRRITEIPHPPDGDFVFDLATESERFCAGVGRLIVHNSPRRGLEFVTRKITWHAAAIKHGLRNEIALGNLDAKRDWGYAKDYVVAMWLMLQQDVAEDFVIATNEGHTVRECVEIAWDEAGLGDWRQHVRLDPQFLRPAEVDHLIGDYSKAERVLGWKPETSFEELIRLMTRADLERLQP
jgi:GDPmannose 4,6-dehydratase